MEEETKDKRRPFDTFGDSLAADRFNKAIAEYKSKKPEGITDYIALKQRYGIVMIYPETIKCVCRDMPPKRGSKKIVSSHRFNFEGVARHHLNSANQLIAYPDIKSIDMQTTMFFKLKEAEPELSKKESVVFLYCLSGSAQDRDYGSVKVLSSDEEIKKTEGLLYDGNIKALRDMIDKEQKRIRHQPESILNHIPPTTQQHRNTFASESQVIRNTIATHSQVINNDDAKHLRQTCDSVAKMHDNDNADANVDEDRKEKDTDKEIVDAYEEVKDFI